MATLRLYVWGAVALAFTALLAALLWYRGQVIAATAEADRARAELHAAVAVNKANRETLERLTAFREIDDRLQSDLQAKLDQLAVTTDQATVAVRDLERANATVRSFLANPLPDDLRRLLNRPANNR
jgi:LysB family phage lysis regulatory protein